MTAPTQPTTDIACLVDGAFQELECVIPAHKDPHGGDVAAYINQHGCRVGWMCKDHLDVYMAWLAGKHGAGTWCYDCGNHMTIEDFAIVQVL